jgi:hypothetical protein
MFPALQLLQLRISKDYTPSKEKVDDLPPALVQLSPMTPPTNGPLHLERPSLDTVL